MFYGSFSGRGYPRSRSRDEPWFMDKTFRIPGSMRMLSPRLPRSTRFTSSALWEWFPQCEVVPQDDSRHARGPVAGYALLGSCRSSTVTRETRLPSCCRRKRDEARSVGVRGTKRCRAIRDLPHREMGRVGYGMTVAGVGIARCPPRQGDAGSL